MTGYEVIEQLAKEKRVENLISMTCKCNRPEMSDLAQMIYIILMNYQDAAIVDLWNKGQMNFFLVGIIKRQFFSKTSTFYKTFGSGYGKYRHIATELNEETIKKAIEL